VKAEKSMTAQTTMDLTLAMAYYEHVAGLTSGQVPVEGARVRWLELPVEEIFHRFYEYREWEISEMSMGKYIATVSQGDDSMVGLPVFPSRVFRHSAFYVRSGEITTPDQLRGKRLGIPEWAQTAAVYMRGLLTHEWDVPLTDVRWYQAGVNQPGRREHVKLALPPGVELTPVPDRSLNDMLLAGDLDAVLSAHPPEAFKSGDPRVSRLFPDPPAVEEEYARRTGIVPIMHLVVVRRDVVDRHPWLVGNLMTAFEESRSRSVARLAAGPAGPGSRVPLLWTDEALARTRAAFGGEPWPYGVDANRATLEAFARWSDEQGVTHRRVEVDELFPASVRTRYRI
jgi:4,5-dihydroxyphthalate decarboxylase